MTAPRTDSAEFADVLAGQYALEREIGRGGMGIVYLAHDLKLDRPVAIKTLPPHLAADPIIRERFLREARTAAALSNPNIVPIHRADELNGQVFFVMGFVDGESLAQRIKRTGRLDPREVLREIRDVALALDYAHRRGVIHRDVKAENILIEKATGRALVTDFGIARLAEAGPLTATGQVLGTVYYMSPEQASGDPVDGRSDLYALGVVGYFALAGRFPFDNELASAVLVAHVTKTPPPLLSVAPDVSRVFAEVIDRCLAKDPDARFQSGADLSEALTQVEGDVHRDAAKRAVVVAPLLSDTEAGIVWKRAAELQAMTGVRPRPAIAPQPRDPVSDAARTSGYSLQNVRDAAAEAGIPAQYVDHALAEHGLVEAGPGASIALTVHDHATKANFFLGTSTTIEFEATVPGEMQERDFDIIVDLIRRRIGEGGALTAVGRSLTWNTLSKTRTVHVSIMPRQGKTTIRVVENLGNLAGGLFGGILGGGGGGTMWIPLGIGLGKFHSPALALAMSGALLLTVYTTARTAFALTARKRRRTLRTLIEELAGQARESIAGDQAPALRGNPSRLKP